MTVVSSIQKGGDPMDPNTYMTTMIDHTLTKLYGAIVEKMRSRRKKGEI